MSAIAAEAKALSIASSIAKSRGWSAQLVQIHNLLISEAWEALVLGAFTNYIGAIGLYYSPKILHSHNLLSKHLFIHVWIVLSFVNFFHQFLACPSATHSRSNPTYIWSSIEQLPQTRYLAGRVLLLSVDLHGCFEVKIPSFIGTFECHDAGHGRIQKLGLGRRNSIGY